MMLMMTIVLELVVVVLTVKGNSDVGDGNGIGGVSVGDHDGGGNSMTSAVMGTVLIVTVVVMVVIMLYGLS